MRWRWETAVPRVQAFEWLTDFTEKDHQGPLWMEYSQGQVVSQRHIISRTPEEVVMEDHWAGRPPVYLTARLFPHERTEFTGRTGQYEFTVQWVFEDLPGGGCAIIGEEAHRLRGLLNKLIEKRIVRSMEKFYKTDREIHFMEMERECAPLDDKGDSS